MRTENQDVQILKELVDTLLNKMKEGFILLANCKGDSVNFIARCNMPLSAGEIVKKAAQLSGGNGGGSNTFAQGAGKTTEHIEEVFDMIRKEI